MSKLTQYVRHLAVVAIATLLAQCAWAYNVGDEITFSNTNYVGQAGISSNGGAYSNLPMCIPASDELPEGSVVTLKSIKLGLRSGNSASANVYLAVSLASQNQGGAQYRASNQRATTTETEFGGVKALVYETYSRDMVVGTQYIGYYRTGDGTATGYTENLQVITKQTGCDVIKLNAAADSWMPLYEVVVTVKSVPAVIDLTASTTVAISDINTAAGSAEMVYAKIAPGATINCDVAPTASTLKIFSEGAVTLQAETKPDYVAQIDFSNVKGAVKRSWLTLPTNTVTGFNFNANLGRNGQGNTDAGTDTALALEIGDWAHNGYDATGTSSAMFLDGLSTLTWKASNVYSEQANMTSGNFIQGYLDDGNGGVKISVLNIPYDEYEVIVYCSTDDSSKKFKAITVNGTTYTWDASTGAVTSTSDVNAVWGLASAAAGKAVIGANTLRIGHLTGPLSIAGGTNGNGARGCISAIQIMKQGTSTAPTMTVSGSVSWMNESLWDVASAPVSGNVILKVIGDATITVDGATVALGSITVEGSGKLTLLTNNEGTLSASAISTSGSLAIGAGVTIDTIPAAVTYLVETTTLKASPYGEGNIYTIGAGSQESPISLTLDQANGKMVLKDGTYYLNQTHSGTAGTVVTMTDATVYALNAQAEAHGFGVGNGTVNLTGTTSLTAAKFVLAQGGAGRSSVFTMGDTTSVTVQQSSNVNNNTASIMFGHWDSSSVFTIKDSASFSAPDTEVLIALTANNQTINVNGGVMDVKGFKLSTGATGTNVMNLNGGELKLGATGITSYGSTAMTINLLGTTTITTTADVVPFAQPITGDGVIIKKGAGTLALGTNRPAVDIREGAVSFTATTEELAAAAIVVPVVEGATPPTSEMVIIYNDEGETLEITKAEQVEGNRMKLSLSVNAAITTGGNISELIGEGVTGDIIILGDNAAETPIAVNFDEIPEAITEVLVSGTVEVSGTLTEKVRFDTDATIITTTDIAINNMTASATFKVNGGTLILTGTSPTKIQVNAGGTFDVNGVKDTSYPIYLNGGTLANNGSGVDIGKKQWWSVTLESDSFVSTDTEFGMIANGHGAVNFQTNGHKLTKKGTGNYILANVTFKNGDENGGALEVLEGSIEIAKGTAVTTATPITGAGKVLLSGGGSVDLGSAKSNITQHFVVTEGTGTLKWTGDGSGAICSNDSKTDPFITVRPNTTLNIYGHDYSGWNGALRDTGWIVNNGTLVFQNDDGSRFWREHVIFGAGSTMKIDHGGRCLLSYGGAGAEDACQFMLPEGSATIQSGTEGNNAVLYFGNDGTGGWGDNDAAKKATGFSVGEDATLTISCPIKGNQAITKHGAGTLVIDNETSSYSGTVSLNAGVIKSKVVFGTNKVVCGNPNMKLAEPTTDGDYTIYSLIQRDATTIQANDFAASGFTLNGAAVTLIDGDIVEFPSTIGNAGQWDGVGSQVVVGHEVIINKSMNWKSNISKMTVGSGVVAYMVDGTILSGATISGDGKFQLQWSKTITGNTTISTAEVGYGAGGADGSETYPKFTLAEGATLTIAEQESGRVVSGVTGKHVTFDEATLTYSLEEDVTEITFTVGAAPQNAVRVVTVNGTEIDVTDNTFAANVGASVVVTYKPAAGYIGNTVNATFTVANPMQTTEITAPTDMNIQKVVAIAYKQLVPAISVECSSLEAAIAVEGAIAIMLTDDINITEPITVEKSSLIDFDGHTITTTSRAFVVQGEDVTLSIGNGSIVGPTDAAAAVLDGKAIITVDGARLEFSDGTLTCGGSGSDGMYGVYVLNGGTAVFGYEEEGVAYGPTISSHFAAIGTNNTTAPATITIHGGEYTAAANTTTERWSYFCAAIYAPSAGSYTINGGTFNGQYAISSRYSNVNQTIAINGGSLNGSVVDIFVDEVIGTAAEDPVRTITIADGVEATIPEGYSWVDGTLTKDSEGPQSWDDVGDDTEVSDIVSDETAAELADSGVTAKEIAAWATALAEKGVTVDLHSSIPVNALIFNVAPSAAPGVAEEAPTAEEAAAEVLKEVIEAEKVDLAELLAKVAAEGDDGLTITSLSTEYPMATIKLVPSTKLESTGTTKFFQLSIELK